MLSLDKSEQMVAEIVRTSEEELPCKQTAPAVVQRESPHTVEASHQELSVAGAVEHVTLPSSLPETQGQHDDLVLVELNAILCGLTSSRCTRCGIPGFRRGT